MLKSPDHYIAQAKRAMGDEHMSDRAFGERLGGYTAGAISTARYGKMSDPMAIKVAELIDAHPGEVLMVARVAREKDQAVRAALEDWASKTLATMSFEKAARPLLAPADVVAAAQKANRPQVGAAASGVGGEGRLRPHPLRQVNGPRLGAFFMGRRGVRALSLA